MDELAARWRAVEDASVPGLYAARRGLRGGDTVELMRPQTFMNLSGEALKHRIHEADDLAPDHLLVVSDDVYLPLGALRLRARGSSGGHRGLASIEAALGHREYARLRIGVGVVADAEGLKDHVLEAFGPEEEAQVSEVVQRAADAVECWASEGIEKAMNRFNRRIRKEVSEP